MNERSIVLSRDPSAVLEGRDWLCRQIEAWMALDPDTEADALVMASELVSNVLLHTDSKPRLTVSRREGVVRIAVHDEAEGLPVVLPMDPHRVGGNGMRVVDAWSDRWGVIAERDGGKTVWFSVHPSGSTDLAH